jgi:hypothetical protein
MAVSKTENPINGKRNSGDAPYTCSFNISSSDLTARMLNRGFANISFYPSCTAIEELGKVAI